ncbi:MAG TPA: cytochrome c3 family protein [Abditibacteriaceae bacterium]|jgi:hypothetical protein
MAQLFSSHANVYAKTTIVGAVLGVLGLSGAVFAFNQTYGNRMYVPVEQPVQFSHKHHVKDDGIDCRYCHSSVEDSAFAGIPPTHTCMSCHSQIWSDSPLLQPVRESLATGQPIPWTRVHDMPDFVYFNHSIHVKKGVGCQTCHGDVSEMPITWKEHTMTMSWCLECHRHPEKYVRPREAIYDMDWKASDVLNPETGKPYSQDELGRKLVKDYRIRNEEQITNCSVCHR